MDKKFSGQQVDERTIMFSRAELEPGTPRYDQYYLDHPEHMEPDRKFRKLPGLLQPGSLFYNPLVFNSAEATFTTVSALHDRIDGVVAQRRVPLDPVQTTRFIKNWCISLGAHTIGITSLKPDHFYSISGRKNNYGEPVVNKHRLAIAITVEMDYNRVRMSPHSPIIMESSAQYLRAGCIAVTLAEFIRGLGYPARAHIDGNYQVRCPQVASDAGLGDIGRMSLLITPDLGPRVRIAVVTTDIPLIISEISNDRSIGDFCSKCVKCAINCPAGAISSGKRPYPEMDWKINQEACYTYWCKTGTDCGRCISVCPYSHKSNLLHSVARFLIRKSIWFRRIAVPLDNWIYGKRPRMKRMEEWM